ncbi:MAG: FHA domain-containing protein [Xanthomonadales bacterium]|nr:FHA domain-containing protein [Xanthomonadales bacterium]
MRLSFPQGEHEDIIVGSGGARIGSARDAEVSLPGCGLEAEHARIDLDPSRGILLRIGERAREVHVNGRPVARLAFLRLGDCVSLGATRILLCADRETSIDDHIPADPPPPPSPVQRVAASRVVLRGACGRLFGRCFPLVEPLVIGSSADAGLTLDEPALAERHCQLEHHGEFIAMRDFGSEDGSMVNGIAVRNARLHPGDQLVIEQQRFVIEAPGLPPRGADAYQSHPGAQIGTTQTMRPVTDDMLAEAREKQKTTGMTDDRDRAGGLLWLIAAAVLIMAGLAALLLYAPGWLD